MKDIRVEKIVIVGVPKTFARDTVKVKQGGKEWETTVEIQTPKDKARSITIRDPKVAIGEDWEIHF
jgi:hypothetical protein